jgi:hypothetical protein
MDDAKGEDFLEFQYSKATGPLNPSHSFNATAAIFSVGFFLLWVFSTPHNSSSEMGLDLKRKLRLSLLSLSLTLSLPPPPPSHRTHRYPYKARAHYLSRLHSKVGSFYVFQVLGNFGVVAFDAVASCTTSRVTQDIANNLYFAACFGVSILGTNLLCHRYLLEKARACPKCIPPPPSPKPSLAHRLASTPRVTAILHTPFWK